MTATKTKSRPPASKKGYILDVGCGEWKQPGAVGMDKQDLPGVDVVHNWNDFPWPFEDDSVLTIVASNVAEHVSPVDGHFIDWMNECWRVLKPEGQLAIVAPYGVCSLYVQDPTHCNPVNEKTFWYFDGDFADYHGGKKILYWGFYKPRPWKIEASFFSAEGQLEVCLRKRAEVPEAWLLPPGTTVTQ